MNIKKPMNQIIGVVVLSMGVLSSAVAGNVTIANTFSAGTPAKAAEVNTNFNDIAAQVNDNDARITSNTTNKQDRITGTCNSGYAIRSIAANGTVICELDDTGIGSITTGAGLTGGGSGAAVSLSIANGGVGTNQIADSAVTGAKIANGTITNTDINAAAAIAASKIAGDMGIEYNNTFWSNGNIPTTITSVGSIVVSAPSAGTVLLFLNGTANYNGVNQLLVAGIGTANNAFNIARSITPQTNAHPFMVMWATPVNNAGNYTYHALFETIDPSSCCTANVYDVNLVALFIPKRY